ncbi:MAG TPA: thiopurine S-methyltransferase [Steroidobacter sp.]|jgi:thiopurine S-methyltransferase|nr:thiopurine S-methyltransferase [Steroidobacter sp.]
MDKSFWLDRWSRREVGFHQARVNPYLERWWPQMQAPSGSAVFVPLCGKSLDMHWLREQGHHVLGIELARDAVGDFFAESGLTPRVTHQPPFERWDAEKVTLWCGDFFDLKAEHLARVSTVFDRASLIAMPPEMRPRYAQYMSSILPPHAATLLVSLTYPQGQMSGPPFSVSEDEIRNLYSDRYTIEQLASIDVLDQNARFKQRGLTELSEQVYRLGPRA